MIEITGRNDSCSRDQTEPDSGKYAGAVIFPKQPIPNDHKSPNNNNQSPSHAFHPQNPRHNPVIFPNQCSPIGSELKISINPPKFWFVANTFEEFA